jgi:hypothetical protein
MTVEEKEIRDSERKAMAEVRRWKRLVQKEWDAMTPEEYAEHRKKFHEKLVAEGFKF